WRPVRTCLSSDLLGSLVARSAATVAQGGRTGYPRDLPARTDRGGGIATRASQRHSPRGLHGTAASFGSSARGHGHATRGILPLRQGALPLRRVCAGAVPPLLLLHLPQDRGRWWQREIGRASCREREWIAM